MPNLWLRHWKQPLLAETAFTRVSSGTDIEWTTGRWTVINCLETGSLLLLSPFPGHGKEVISFLRPLKREKHTGYLVRLRWAASQGTISVTYLTEELTKPANLTLLEKCQSYCMCLAGPCCTATGRGNSLSPHCQIWKAMQPTQWARLDPYQHVKYD